ncbi:DUF4382 domain-containing protein [Halonotius sp. GCM10025705]|uniref:DUF4382 domain-containing protein n=1 Tax=Halonotius sp. GCM10025705 TaxID=3252678 RepID=UPI0036064BB0
MPSSREHLDRRTYLKTTGLATAGMVGLAGCTGDSDSGSGSDGGGDGDGTTYGTLSTAVTDQPSAIDDFESLTVTIDGIWITPAGGDEEDADDEAMNETDTNETNTNETTTNETDVEDAEDDEEMEEADADGEDGGRRYIEFEEPQEADLVQLQGSSTKLIDETEVETGDYAFLQINVAGTEGILTDGSEAEVTTPGNAPLKFNTSFEIRPEETTRFIADFAPNKRGRNGYIIRPVATSTTVLYGDEEYDGGDGNTTDDSGNTTDEETMDGNQTADGGSQNETTTNQTA